MDDDLGLFDAAPFTVNPVEEAAAVKLSADRRRTLRQAAAITRGVHPLGLVFAGVRMHPDADRAATASDARSLPLRCVSCRFRQQVSGGDRSFPKCLWRDENPTDQEPRRGGAPRNSGSAASDVRAWWPACDQYTPGDSALSDDAARWIPVLTNA